MCNLYSMTKSQAAIREWIRAMRDATGNLPRLPGIFPDMMAPIVRTGSDSQRELVMARWGMPSPPRFVTGIDRGVTNIRNASSPHWRGWLKPENRCLVPATSFCEYTDKSPKVPTWFALGEDRSLFAFAGIWCRWHGTRGTKKDLVEGEHTLFGFLTTDADAVVKPVHAKAMPVILTESEAMDQWMTAPAAEALELQRPLSDDALQIVMRGEKEDAIAACRLPTTAVSMSLAGSCFSSESAPRPFHHGIRRRGGTIFRAALSQDERQVQADMRTHLIHRPARDIIPPLGGARVSSYRV